MRLSVAMPPFQGVAAGQTATVVLPIGRRYHELNITYAGATLAQLNEIRVLVNGEIFHRYSGTERDAMNQFDGRAAASGILTLPFDRYNLLQRAQEEAFALNTGSEDKNGVRIASLSLEVDIDGAALNPALSLKAEQSSALPGGPGKVLRVQKFSRGFTGAGVVDIADIPAGPEGRNRQAEVLNRIFFGSAVVTAVKLERDNFTIFDRLAAENNLVQSDGVRTPQAGYYVLDPSERGYGGDAIQILGFQDFRYKLTLSGAATIPVIGEFIGDLQG